MKNNMNRFGRAEANRVLRLVMDKRMAHTTRNAMCKWRDYVKLEKAFYTQLYKKNTRGLQGKPLFTGYVL